MDGITNLISASDIGLVDKAVIQVIEGEYNTVRGKNKDNSVGLKLAGPNTSTVKVGGGDISIGKLASGAVRGMGPATRTLNDLAGALTQAFEFHSKSFTVPFNPASFSLSGNAGGNIEINDFSDGNTGRNVSYMAAPLTIRMDVDLILNDVDPSDAFLETNATNIKGVANTAKKALGMANGHSIRKEVEGLIAATRSFESSIVSFNWGAMSYCGELERLDADYKMFNPAGEPIAGTVHMTILLIDKGVNEKSMGKWCKAYQDAFADKGARSLAPDSQKYGGGALANFTL